MVNKHTKSSAPVAEQIYWGADVPMQVIRSFACAVAERFQPDKIILFGSHAYGTPHPDSDVDILVVMPTRRSNRRHFTWKSTTPSPRSTLQTDCELSIPASAVFVDRGCGNIGKAVAVCTS